MLHSRPLCKTEHGNARHDRAAGRTRPRGSARRAARCRIALTSTGEAPGADPAGGPQPVARSASPQTGSLHRAAARLGTFNLIRLSRPVSAGGNAPLPGLNTSGITTLSVGRFRTRTEQKQTLTDLEAGNPPANGNARLPAAPAPTSADGGPRRKKKSRERGLSPGSGTKAGVTARRRGR